MSPKFKRDRELKWIPISRIIPNENNPRDQQHFTKEALLPLRASVETHGLLEPILVQPYKDGPRDDRYLINEGERRYTVATDLGLKEMPAIITNRLDDHDQVTLMFNVHANRKGWEMAEELNAIKMLRERNGHMSDAEMARELGMHQATYRERVQVLEMGEQVVTDIAKSQYEYSSALRVRQITNTLEKKRPDIVKQEGGPKAVQKKLLQKARVKGVSQELVEARKDMGDVKAVPDEVVRSYISDPKARLHDVRRGQLAERRKAEGLAKELGRVERNIRDFDVDLDEVPNLRALRQVLAGLVDAATELESRVARALIAE
jgi:ParB/RepB/Spo0J family partition protein